MGMAHFGLAERDCAGGFQQHLLGGGCQCEDGGRGWTHVPWPSNRCVARGLRAWVWACGWWSGSPGMVSRLRQGACPAAGMPRVLSRSLEPWISPRRPGWCFVRRERPKSKAQTRVAGAGSLSDGSSETQDDWTIQTNIT